MTAHNRLYLLFLPWVAIGSLHRLSVAQDATFPAPPPLPVPGAAPAEASPSAEVHKPIPFSEQERRVLNSADKLPVERLQELLDVYQRLNNTSMVDALVRAILRRDPKNAKALSARSSLDPDAAKSEVGYLDSLAKKVLSGEKVDDVDSVGVQAGNLLDEDKNEAALKLLLALKKNQFGDTFFPYLDHLARAYTEVGKVDEGEEAYKEVIKDQRFPVEVGQAAERILPTLDIKRRMVDVTRDAGADLDRLVAGAKQLVEERPTDFDVVSFYVESLDRAKRYDEAVDFLLKQRDKAPAGVAWPWKPTLAFAYYGAKRFDEAVATFTEIKDSPLSDPAAKLEAESMVAEITKSRDVENGISALNRQDMAAAEAVLKKMESERPNDPDTIGYKSIYLSKLGKTDEALALLRKQQQTAKEQGKLFTEADSLADVYASRKEYSNARATLLAIISDSRYDEQAKADARLQLTNIQVSEKLEDGYAALRDSKRTQAKRVLEEVRQFAPNSPDVAVFSAEVDLAYQRPEQALEQLSRYKAKAPANEPFMGQNSYAGALAQTGQWQSAMDEYQQVLTNPGYSALDRFEATWMSRGLLTYVRPFLQTSTRFVTEEEGSLLSTDWQYMTAWKSDWRFGAFTRADSSSVKGESAFAGLDGDRVEGGAVAQRLFSHGYFAEATVGASGDGALYSARFGKMAFQRLNWSVGWDGNARATDSLALQALDGRENRLGASLYGPLSERVVISAQTYYNWTEIDGENLGNGFGLELGADYILQSETPTRPELTAGYVGEYRKFRHSSTIPSAADIEIRRAVEPEKKQKNKLFTGDETTDILNTLADPETNRHGTQFTISKHLGDSVNAFSQAGLYYAFDDESVEFTGSLGAEFWITPHSMLFTEFRYNTSGMGVSSGEGVFEANVGGTFSF